MSAEMWKQISSYGGKDLGVDGYQVSSHGRVRSLPRMIEAKSRWGGRCLKPMPGRVLKDFRAGAGYRAVMFSMGGPKMYVHRLVAEAFIVGDTTLQVNHKDGVKSNNSASNLEWVTASDNARHSTHIMGNINGQFLPGGGRVCR